MDCPFHKNKILQKIRWQRKENGQISTLQVAKIAGCHCKRWTLNQRAVEVPLYAGYDITVQYRSWYPKAANKQIKILEFHYILYTCTSIKKYFSNYPVSDFCVPFSSGLFFEVITAFITTKAQRTKDHVVLSSCQTTLCQKHLK